MILMRVLLCKKIQCPFMCFCKPSASHVYSSAPENSQEAVSDESESSSGAEAKRVEQEGASGNCGKAENVRRSCIRSNLTSSRPDSSGEEKRVRWKDALGEELAQIKEFVSSERWDTDSDDESSSCICVIL